MKNHQQFFEKALAIQAQRQEKLTEAEKKDIALQLGFSEADWQAVLASFDAHLKRGTEFLKRHNYEKAIIELEDALIIQPEHTDTLAALAQAYLGLFQHKKRKNLKEKALQYAQECLQYAPDNFQAHQVIDAFNPNKPTAKPYPSARTSSKSSSTPSAKMGMFITWACIIVAVIAFFTVLTLSLRTRYKGKQSQEQHAQYTEKSTQNKNQTQQSNQQSRSSSYTVKYESPLAFEMAALPQDLAKKYLITQKDSITWQVSTLSKVPLMELSLIENKWWYPAYSDSKKTTRYYADLTLELKTLCDSLRFDALFFTFQVIDTQGRFLQQEDSVYVAQRSSYDRWMYFPKDYFFRADESNALYFRYSTKEIGQEHIGQDSALRPSKIVLKVQEMQTARPPVYKEKAIKIKNAHQDVDIFELKEGFMEDPGSPYSIHFWALKIKNKHPERAAKTLGIIIKYYDKNKQLIQEGSELFVHNLTTPLAAGEERICKLRTHLGEHLDKKPPIEVKPKDIAYKEVEFYVLEWK